METRRPGGVPWGGLGPVVIRGIPKEGWKRLGPQEPQPIPLGGDQRNP